MKRVLLFAILLVVFIQAKSQYVQEFSQDTAQFILELSETFGKSLNEDEKLIFNEFKYTWDSIDYSYRTSIMNIAELMRQRSCRPRPHYIMYIRILEQFFRYGKQDFGVSEWLKGYTTLMENKSTLLKEINTVNQSIYLILTESKLYSSATQSWRFVTPSFKISHNGLRVMTTKNDLVGLSGGDSIIVYNVQGYFDPLKQVFFGTKGNVYWDRIGIDRESIYAELNSFKIELKTSGYKADSAVFYHKQLLSEPALGVLEDRISRVNNIQRALYPKFTTFQSNYQLDKILPGIDYSGAISMQGANFVGTSSGNVKAVLDVYNNDTLRAKIRSNIFLFYENSVRSNNVELSIYLENDSIYHPYLIMNYNTQSQVFRFQRSKDFNSQGPYANSYHKIDMVFDELNWKRTEPELKMEAAVGTALGNGFFESYDYYNQQSYESLQGMDYENPLVKLWYFGRELGGDTFSSLAYASHVGIAPYVVRQVLMRLSKLGFVYYDFDKEMVTLRAKLFDYIDASMQNRDYDVINFISRTKAGLENASLNLSTKDLTIHGIPTIFLSDSQNVKIVPLNNTIIMKRNRDFQFDGVIDAGLFKFYGNNFFFEYSNFRVNLQSIDSLSISAKTGESDQYGFPILRTLDNKIEKITGELLIDAPFNKSGLMSFPEYPIFTSRENSYVFFDEKSIQGGVYDRDRFYFQLVPFSIDSLDNFSRDALKMDGTFVSAGILPEMEMEMSLRPDNSLGFHMTTPEEGLKIYNGQATFLNDLEMSSSGLHGAGSLEYISSTTWSDDFLFHPDSLMTTSRRFLEDEYVANVSYPYVENDVTNIVFYPVKDLMKIDKIQKSFKIYSDSLYFGGNLELTPAGLSGTGALAFPDAIFKSDAFNFQAKNINADSAGISLRRGRDEEELALITDDMSIDIDLIAREGLFTSRNDYTLIDLPVNLYETKLDHIVWQMNEKQVIMSQENEIEENQLYTYIDSLNINAPTYLSKRGTQDSLKFVSPKSEFDYKNYILNAEEVPFVDIGDSYVFPDSGKVQILEKAEFRPLRNAKILANKSSRYHLLHSANLKIDSRLHFRGSADYDYVDEFGDTFTIRLNHVEVDTSINTFGIGDIAVEDSFRLSPYYEFTGQVRMQASDSLLTFAGGVRLTHDCDVGKYWLKFESRIDPDSILIPVGENMQNIDLNRIYAGTLKARDSIHIYPTFLSGRKDYFDRNITYADGYMYYDKGKETYEIASLEKLSNTFSEGNYLALNTSDCELFGEGSINLQLDFGRLKIKTVGEAMHSISANELNLRLLLGMDFYFNAEALNMLGKELDSLPNLEPVDITTDFYKIGVKNLVGEKLAGKLENEIGLYGEYSEIPDSMKFSILFNDIPLKWNQETRSYRLNGKVGIGTVGNIQVNKYVDAYIEFIERGSGDIFDIYLMVDENNWYYMAYSPGGFQVLTSNQEFNSMIFDIPDKERRLKSSGKQKSYIYSLASARRLGLFKDRFLLFENEQ